MIPSGITAQHVRLALVDLDRGNVTHRFTDSTGYDLLFEGRRYPPKAVIGLAARHLPGRAAPLTPADFSGGEGSTCFAILRRLGFEIVPKPSAATASNRPPTPDPAGERSRRMSLWRTIAGTEPAALRIPPTQLRELGIYGGAQGIWTDAQRTSVLTADGGAVTVAVLHTGSSYADDFSDDGVIYHYPATRRASGRDAAEISATKAAFTLGLPIFVISHSPGSDNLRDVHLGWVHEWDDDDGLFLISFGKEPLPAASPVSETELAFSMFGTKPGKRTTTTARPEQQKFRFDVVKRYGVRCAVCPISVLELLDAAHVVPQEKQGSYDSRNGMVLCAAHHRAFDAGLFGIEPGARTIHFRANGPFAAALGLTEQTLSPLRSAQPHESALQWAWDVWRKKHGAGINPV